MLSLESSEKSIVEDIFRSQIVFLDSALDFYIHEIVKYGIIKMFNDEWEKSTDYKKIKVSLSFAINLAQNPESSSKFSDEIDEMNNYSCFMNASKLQRQLNFIDVKCKLNISETELLNSLYKRRNEIAHQSDRTSTDSLKQAISKAYVQDYIDKVETLILKKIHPAIEKK